MIDNGVLQIQEVSIDVVNDRIYKVKYEHKKAIEGIKDDQMACTVIIDVPNTYLKSLLEFLNAETFRFTTKGITYANEDKILLDKTDSIIIGYTFKYVNKYFKKVLIKDQQEFTVEKSGNNITFLKGEI